MPSPARAVVALPAAALLAAPLLAAAPAAAQQAGGGQPAPAAAELTRRLAAMTAVSGYEQRVIDTLLGLLPGAARDRAGSAVLVLGPSPLARLVACPVDEPGFVVGGVRDDGYLTLRPVPGRGADSLLERQLEGQRVTVHGTRGPVPGVVGVRSIHLTRGRTRDGTGAPFTADSAYVDVGAESGAAALATGARVLAPVALAKRPHSWGHGLLAAPVSGRRAACAALLAAARRSVADAGAARRPEGVAVAFAVEEELSGRGLATLANALGPFRATVVLDAAPGPAGRVARRPDPDGAARAPGLGRVERWSLGVRYAGSPVESVALADADLLARELVAWIAAEGGAR